VALEEVTVAFTVGLSELTIAANRLRQVDDPGNHMNADWRLSIEQVKLNRRPCRENLAGCQVN
jgi:hypothetical protein